MLLDRDRQGEAYPWIEWKVRFFVIGAGLGVGGMVMEIPWLIPVAMGVLAAGFLLRFLPGGKGLKEDEAGDPPPR